MTQFPRIIAAAIAVVLPVAAHAATTSHAVAPKAPHTVSAHPAAKSSVHKAVAKNSAAKPHVTKVAAPHTARAKPAPAPLS